MKNRECINCGSTQFHPVKNGWKCDYCGTFYLDETKVQKTSSLHLHPAKLLKKRNKKSILISLFALLIFTGLVVYLSINNKQSSMSDDTITYPPLIPGDIHSSENLIMPANWTKELYDSIVVATEHYDEDSEKYSYEGGSSYEELEKIVGKPDTVTSFEKEEYGTPPHVMVTWEKTKQGERAGRTFEVTYDKKTLMITDKKFISY